MISLKDILSLSSPLRLITVATIAGLVIAHPTHEVLQERQTYSVCNPLQQSGCPANPALGKSVKIDFTSGASSLFTATGNPTYDSNGASFTVAKGGDAPTLTSKWYIMFGTYSITMKAAPGAGIVSSSVLQSDDLDEIDWEWLGAQDDQVQSNYFGKGQTTTYDRAAVHAVSSSQGNWHTYTIDWTEEQIVWQIDGTTVRVLTASSANGMFPQTPMQLKVGSWSGGDPSNPAGTVAWAQGPTDYSSGPFKMVVRSISVTDYSTGTSYEYGNESGDWSSIESNGGAVNANAGASNTDASAPAITSTSSGAGEPFSGTHADCTTCTTPGLGTYAAKTVNSCTQTAAATSYLNLPSGYAVDSCSGKVVPPSAAPVSKHHPPSSHTRQTRVKIPLLTCIYSRRPFPRRHPRRLFPCQRATARHPDIVSSHPTTCEVS